MTTITIDERLRYQAIAIETLLSEKAPDNARNIIDQLSQQDRDLVITILTARYIARDDITTLIDFLVRRTS